MVDQSLHSRLSDRLLPLVSKRVFPPDWMEAGDEADLLASIAGTRRRLDGPRPDALLRRKWGRATTNVAGRDLHLLTASGGSNSRVLFYCHGGTFVLGPSAFEWLFAARVASALDVDLAVYEYPKVPEVDSATILESSLSAYDEIERRYPAEDIVIGGTSAGAGLAVATLLMLLRAGRDLPAAAVLFSPWLDMTISHPEVDAYVDSDLLLPLERLRRDGELYAGSTDLRDPLVSPRFASKDEMSAMPPFAVTAGEHEILLPEAREFVDNLAAAGVHAILVVEPHGQHAGVAGFHPEAKAVLAESLGALAS